MRFERTGVILCTENYDECVLFYSDTLGLPKRKVLDDEHSKLTVVDFGTDTYLMIETGGEAVPEGKTIKQNPAWLRFNVVDVDAAATELIEKGVEVSIRREVWGTVGDFKDPDGNICSLREEQSPKPAY
jgi:lactoylglutathione lyase